MNRTLLNKVCYGVVFLCSLAAVVTTVVRDPNPRGALPLGRDFVIFDAASQLAITGHPEGVYNLAEHHHAMESLYGVRIPGSLPFFYPPNALMLFAPLAAIPVYWSWCLWLGVGLLLYALPIWRIFRNANVLYLALSFPAVLLNLYWGQNAFISVALILGFLCHTDSNPILAGLFLGLLFYKPQFAFYCVIAVIAARKWKCLSSALTTLAALVIGSLLIWGPQLWASYFTIVQFSRSSFLSEWLKSNAVQPTVFSFLRLTGFDPGTALKLQYLVSVAMGGVVYAVWQRRPRQEYLANSVLGCCILLGVPYYQQYDTLLAIIPLCYYAQYERQVAEATRKPGLMLWLWSMPVFGWAIVLMTTIQIVPIICSAVLLAVLRDFVRVKPDCATGVPLRNRSSERAA